MKATHSDKCPSVEQLADCLDPVTLTADVVTRHLERCDTCRQTLSFLAGGPQWWEAAESFLSTESTKSTDACSSESRAALSASTMIMSGCSCASRSLRKVSAGNTAMML